MSWRPEGWDSQKIIREAPSDSFDADSAVGMLVKVFEAGAESMLEALKKKGAWMTPEQMKLLAPDRQYPFGYIVFIPDDKEPPQPQRGMTLFMAANVLEHLKDGQLPGTVSELDQACSLGTEAIKRIQAIREGLSISPYVDLPGELRPERREAC
jgi:hypothetical protein